VTLESGYICVEEMNCMTTVLEKQVSVERQVLTKWVYKEAESKTVVY